MFAGVVEEVVLLAGRDGRVRVRSDGATWGVRSRNALRRGRLRLRRSLRLRPGLDRRCEGAVFVGERFGDDVFGGWEKFGVSGVDRPDEVWCRGYEVKLRGGGDAGLAGRGVTRDFESPSFGDGSASLGFEEAAVDDDV